MDLLEHNRQAWNREVSQGNPWTIPVDQVTIEAARRGEYRVVLTPHKPVPSDWLGALWGKDVLCLASGGGQQGPILAAAGARVTVLDNSDAQLARDRELADVHGLDLATLRGNMQDLSAFADATFDLIVHPVSNCFIDDILPVWRECYRVLRPGGSLLAGFCNPLMFMIDWEDADETGRAELRHAVPYSDLESLSPAARQRYIDERIPFEFGHT